MSSSSGKKGSKKVGRCVRKPSHARYNNMNMRLKNKIKKLKKHIKSHENDKCAIYALKVHG